MSNDVLDFRNHCFAMVLTIYLLAECISTLYFFSLGKVYYLMASFVQVPDLVITFSFESSRKKSLLFEDISVVLI